MQQERNFKKAIIMAAGSGKRWENYLGVPKQLVLIDGEKLLMRTIRQLEDRGFEVIVTVPKPGYFGKLAVIQLLGSDDAEIDKFLNAKSYAGALFLWGDAYFSDKAINIITKDSHDFMFFGREKMSHITGKRCGELFALRSNQMVLDKAKELKGMSSILERCASWELYRLICGYPLTEHIVGKHFTEIDDFTEDFDYPEEYETWLKHYNNSLCEKK